MNEPVDEQSNYVISLLENAYISRVNNLNGSVRLAEKALAISREMHNKNLIGKSLNQLSLFHMIMGDYAQSMSMSEEAIGYFKELSDEKGLADAKYNIAGIYYKSDNFHLGLVYLIDCLTIYRKFNDYHNQARVHKSLGTIYEYFGDQKNAIKSYEDSITSARKAKDASLESNAYNPLSGIYLKQNQKEKALDIIEKSIGIKQETGDIRGLAFALYGRAKVYTSTGKFVEAEDDFKKALVIHEDAGERLGAAMAYRKMGGLYMDMGAFDLAKAALGKALEVSNKYNIAMVRFKSNYHLYQIYKQENDPVQSLKYLERYLKQKEAVINAQTLQVIENYELITKMESMEKETQLQKEKAEIIEKKNLAEQAFKVRQEFLSTMSHEIRTPLNAVITISSLLKDKSDQEEQELLNSLRFAANNLFMIVNDILDFTRLDTGKARIEPHPTHFRNLLENLKRTYESLAREKGLQLFLRIDQDVAAHYEMDETKVSQILANLISNAIKYTDTGQVDITVEKVMGEADVDILRFRISDTGPGIPDEHLEIIFDSFSQPHSITTRKQGGSGLGLAIVKKLAELHNSQVLVTSEIGKGSVFYFDLELKIADEQDKSPVRLLDQLKDMTILLAEDNPINAMVAIKLLSNWGVKTEHAKNGLEVVEKSCVKQFDFILMDLHMPEMNGFEATRHIRNNDNPNTHTPIFALTADITADQQESYLAYFNGFLRKPIEIDKMYDALVKAKGTS